MKNTLRWHAATVRAHRDLTPTVREFEIRPDGGVQPWTVGSHLNVRVPVRGRDETRSYSLVGLPHAPGAGEVYRIAVKRAEPGRGGSRHLWTLESGAELAVGEPNNHFELAFGATQYLLVAGGIGITPIVGMAQLLAQRGADLRMCYAARSDAELAYAAALREALGTRLRTFTADNGQRLDLAAEIAALAPGGQLWICGPLPLLDAAREAWANAGRSPADLRFETFGNSGRFDAEPFWVELPRHGLRLQVPADRSLLDVLDAAGVDTLYDCRRGECGLCTLDILSVEGRVDHRDVFFSDDEKQAGRRLCACVSRVSGGGVVLDSAWRPD
ncbi:MAG TPA: PDR/VanB family oxidoreductase [Burkholderiaceae bacterium]|nr:PDR/VanB family oxidoreductase [Burkholderiaceae bacterium]